MTGKQSAEFPNMAQRAVMQYLSLDEWKVAARLPIPAGEFDAEPHTQLWLDRDPG